MTKAPMMVDLQTREQVEALKTAQLWAMLRTRATYSNQVYWAKCELRARGYNVQ